MKTLAKLLVLWAMFALFWGPVFAQSDIRLVEAKGIGAPREDALNDALRNAIGQVAGVELSSQTQVENFELVSDAISTRVNGYIAGYDVLNETSKDGLFTVNVKAKVSNKALKADAQYLARAVGGIRFLAMYDEREFNADEKKQMNFAIERMNQYLSSKKYRYIEKTVFDRLKTEASNIVQDSDTSDLNYVQQLGLKSGAQFIIMLKSIRTETRTTGAFGTKVENRTVIEAKSFDNCTAEGLGTVVLEGPWKEANDDGTDNAKAAISENILTQTDKLMEVFNTYVADWVNNGTPFELRFVGSGTFRDLRDLRKQLQADKLFGGQMELVGADGYMALNCTFRNKPEDLADKILTIADGIPALKTQNMDVRLIYGRQITFGPGSASTAPTKPKPLSKTVEAAKARKKK
jgi:hypothetical protein